MNEQRRFLNQSQPQTLVMATILCYIQAVFGFLSFTEYGLILAVGLGFGGYGIANEKKWGYLAAVITAVGWVLIVISILGLDVLEFPFIISFIFDVGLAGLLLHTESREYQRIWFK